ncbi:MAG: sigma-54 interaction domain-containing protein [Sumerlaeia bacterium]
MMKNLPALSSRNQQITIRLSQNILEVLSWPKGLSFNGFMPESLPSRIPTHSVERHAAAKLFITASVLLKSQKNASNFVLPIASRGGEPTEYYLLSTELQFTSAAPTAFLTLENITEVVLQRRRSAYIGTYHGIIGRSSRMLEVFHRISLYGPTDASVIITGETGTGKELIARALHDTSKRAGKPFVPVNCTALSPELFESELFGHEKGSFTGAFREHKGRFERADGGTLFLDEIGDMPAITQAKLLRALEEGVIERVGSEKEKSVDVRVVAATNVGLEQAVAEKRFRSDLFHRLSVFRIHLPALRERPDDIPLIANYFLSQFNRRYSKNIQRISPEAIRRFQGYSWPGNIRELRNVIERLVVETFGDAIGTRSLAPWEAEREYFMPGGWNLDVNDRVQQPIIVPSAPAPEPLFQLPSYGGTPPQNAQYVPQSSATKTKQELTTQTIQQAYEQAEGNLTEAARILGVHKATLYRNMRQLDLTREHLEERSSKQ